MKQLMFMISTEGKSPEEITEEAMVAHRRYKRAKDKVSDPDMIITEENKTIWHVQIGGFLYGLWKDREVPICDFEWAFPRVLSILGLSGEEKRPYSNEEIDYFLNSDEFNQFRDWFEQDGSLLPVKRLEE